MFRADLRLARKIRDRSRDFHHPIEPAAGESHAIHRAGKHVLGLSREAGSSSSDGTGEVRVARDAEVGVSPFLAFSSDDDSRSNGSGGLALGRPEELVLRKPRHGQSEIDPVDEGSGQLLPVSKRLVVAAPALLNGIVFETTRAGVGRGDQRESSGELDGADGSRHDDAAVLERLAKRFDRVSPELGQLIQELVDVLFVVAPHGQPEFLLLDVHGGDVLGLGTGRLLIRLRPLVSSPRHGRTPPLQLSCRSRCAIYRPR